MTPHRLARDLGWSVAELGGRMTADEYLDWLAFYHAEAFQREHQQEKARKGLS